MNGKTIFSLLFLSLLVATSAAAQVIVSPQCMILDVQVDGQPLTGPTTIPEGIDFAKSQLQNPWDFTPVTVAGVSRNRDFGFDRNFSAPTFTNGIWSATGAATSDVYPLFSGFSNTNLQDPLPGDVSRPRYGFSPLNQIDTTAYSHLSFRAKHSETSDIKISWKNSANEIGEESFSNQYPLVNSFGFDFNKDSWFIHHMTMTDFLDPWSGDLVQLMVTLLTSAASQTVSFDWIRLVDPTSAPELVFDVTYIPNGGDSYCLPSQSGPYVMTIYAKNSAEAGTPVYREEISFLNSGAISTFTASFPSAILPPGSYTFYADFRSALDGSVVKDIAIPTQRDLLTSETPALTIESAPIVLVKTPSPIATESYDDVARQNQWDMSDSADVANVDTTIYDSSTRNFRNDTWTFINGLFRAATGVSLTIGSGSEPFPGDNGFEAKQGAQIHLATDPTTPIDPNTYRYLVYRMRGIENATSASIDAKRTARWFSQAVYWNTQNEFNYGWTRENFTYEGWNTYVIDLWENDSLNGKPWFDYRQIANLRLQPMNSRSANVGFEVDWVKLYKENRTGAGSYNIEYEIVDPSGTNATIYTVSAFYLNAVDSSSLVKIGDSTVAGTGSKTFTWDIGPELADGSSYDIYLQVRKGLMTNGSYASAPLTVGEEEGEEFEFPRAPLDFDGDGNSDQTVYRSTTGQNFQRLDASVSQFIPWVAGSQYIPLEGDFDGDGITDLAFAFEYLGYIGWYIYKSDTTLPVADRLFSRIWGFPGDTLAVGDYDGDGADDIAVYREGMWYILYEDDTAEVEYWGFPEGDVPVPADYDGDGVTDFAIWRPDTGEWWVLNSGYLENEEVDYYSYAQWGLPGDTPVPADYSGNGRVDFAIYRPSLGIWAVLENDDHNDDFVIDDAFEIEQWGLPSEGDIPVVGDFNGDGHADFTVFRESSGFWFHNFRNKKIDAVQYGLPGDRIPGVIKTIPASN